MKIEEISKVIFIFLSSFSFSFSSDHVMRMRIKVVPVAGHLDADRDLGGRVTDLEYHGQITPFPLPSTPSPLNSIREQRLVYTVPCVHYSPTETEQEQGSTVHCHRQYHAIHYNISGGTPTYHIIASHIKPYTIPYMKKNSHTISANTIYTSDTPLGRYHAYH